jgi:hypothetical protein
VSGVGCYIVPFVDVAVKHGEPDKESYADQIFNAFDVRVIIHHGENFLNPANG